MKEFSFQPSNYAFLCGVLLIIAALLPSLAHAGAWTQTKGHGFYKLSETVIRATNYYEPSGNRIAIPTLATYTTGVYAEYGLTGRLTLVGYVPLIKRITLNKQVERSTGFVLFNGDHKTGIADTDIGARIGLLQGGASAVSVQVMLGVPVGDDAQLNGLYTGDGEFNQYVALQAGRSFYPAPLYITGDAGINHRTGGYSDEFRYGLEIGYTMRERVTFIARVRGVESLKNGDNSLRGGTGGLGGNNQRYLAYGPEVSYRLNDRLGLTAGVDGAARGKNVLAAPAYMFGVFVQM